MSLNVFQHFSCFVAIYTAILCILLKCEVVTLEIIVLSTKMTALSRAIEYLVHRIKAKLNKWSICAFSLSMFQAITLSRSYRRSLLWGLSVYTKYRFTWCVAVSHVMTDDIAACFVVVSSSTLIGEMTSSWKLDAIGDLLRDVWSYVES